MVLNPDKYSFMLLGVNDSLQTNLVHGDEIVKNTHTHTHTKKKC